MTIKEIAKLSGVSIATVSRIINNDESFRVSMDTKNKVIDIIQKHGYFKKNIKNKEGRYKIGIIKIFEDSIEDENSYYSSFYIKLKNNLKKEKIKFEIFSKQHLKENDYDSFKFLDAILVIGLTSVKFVNKLLKYNKNIICLDSDIRVDGVDTVGFDYRLSVKKVIDYLTREGHSKIALITGKYDEKDFRAKYFKELIEKRRNLKKSVVKTGEFTKESGYKLMMELLKTKNLTAVFCGNDNIAIGVYKAIYKMNKKIPDDISVIGFNDNKTSKFLNPPLTTVGINLDNIINISIKLLKERIYDNRNFTCNVEIQTDLIIRKSCKKINTKK